MLGRQRNTSTTARSHAGYPLRRLNQMGDERDAPDVLGLKAVAGVLSPLTKGVVDGASAFLGRICLPAAEEFGLLLRDRVTVWRARNAAEVLGRAESAVGALGETDLHAPPRIVAAVLEHGSWTADEELHRLWGGLLASACTPTGDDDSNVIFADLLARLTSSEARVLAYVCRNCEIRITTAGWLHAYPAQISVSALAKVTGVSEPHRLDRELSHLAHLGLVDGGFARGSTEAHLAPTSMGLQMFARCEGSREAPERFFAARSEPPAFASDEPLRPSSPSRRVARATVLVVDDEPAIGKALKIALDRRGYDTRVAQSGLGAMEVVQSTHVDVMVTDLRMEDMRGDVLFETAVIRQPHLKKNTLFITGDISQKGDDLIAATGCGVLKKPFELKDLVQRIEALRTQAR